MSPEIDSVCKGLKGFLIAQNRTNGNKSRRNRAEKLGMFSPQFCVKFND